MALEVDAAALLVYRAAWTRDCVADRVTREAAMAKLFATEAAQRVVDAAVQLFGGGAGKAEHGGVPGPSALANRPLAGRRDHPGVPARPALGRPGAGAGAARRRA